MKSSPLVRQASTEKESTKSENLTEYLIEAIVEGQLAPGSKISEPELAKQFQVSRGPLREALMRVEGLGLIERIPHIGARVIQLSPTKLVELYAVREALEGMAARLAARNITEIELAGLESLLSTHSTHIDQVEGASYFHQQGDFDFHYRIIQASRNQQLIGLLCDELYHLLRMYPLPIAAFAFASGRSFGRTQIYSACDSPTRRRVGRNADASPHLAQSPIDRTTNNAGCPTTRLRRIP